MLYIVFYGRGNFSDSLSDPAVGDISRRWKGFAAKGKKKDVEVGVVCSCLAGVFQKVFGRRAVFQPHFWPKAERWIEGAVKESHGEEKRAPSPPRRFRLGGRHFEGHHYWPKSSNLWPRRVPARR
jgi:hypothetical protein